MEARYNKRDVHNATVTIEVGMNEAGSLIEICTAFRSAHGDDTNGTERLAEEIAAELHKHINEHPPNRLRKDLIAGRVAPRARGELPHVAERRGGLTVGEGD